MGPLCSRSASLLRLPFSVLPLEEQWRSTWGAITSLTAEETFGLARRLGLSLPVEDPFLPSALRMQPRSTSDLQAAAAAWERPDATEEANGAAHPVEAVAFDTEDLCRDICEAFIDRRNPQKVPKAYATFMLSPMLPTATPTANNNKNRGGRRSQRRQYERVKSLVALSLFLHTVIEMLSDVSSYLPL